MMNTVVLKTFCILSFLFLSATASAETKSTAGLWIGSFFNLPTQGKFHLWSEVQLRHNFEAQSTGQTLFRTGPLWSINEIHSAGLLYAFVTTALINEHRLTQQWTSQWSTHFSTRLRFEQRTLEQQSGVSLRARALTRGRMDLSEKLALLTWNEAFFHVAKTSWVTNQTLDRNRFFFGLSSQISTHTLEYGYMNQFTVTNTFDHSEHLFVLYSLY